MSKGLLKTSLTWAKVNSFTANSSSKSLQDQRPCPICTSVDSKTLLELNDFQFYSDSSVEPKRVDLRQVMCRSCSAIYLNPCYSKDGFKILFAEAGQSYGSLSQHVQAQIEWLSDHGLLEDGSNVLDVGCYEGEFLSQLPGSVHKLGVDIDEIAIERGRVQHRDKDIKFYSGDFETFSYDGPPPQTITMFHVLEHLPNPVDVLRRLYTISDDDSRLVVEVPILEKSATNDICGFFIEQHTTHFSQNSLHHCLERAGWEIEEQFEVSDYNGYRVLAKRSEDRLDGDSISYSSKDWSTLLMSMANWYDAVGDVERIIQEILDTERFVIWGAGAHTEHLYQVTSFFNTNREKKFVIVDSDPLKHDKTWRGISIYDSSVLETMDWTSTRLIISSYASQDTMYDIATEMKVPEDKIVRLYETIIRY